MNTAIHEIIQRCQCQGIQLSPNGDKLRVIPASKVTPELRAALLQHKPEILRMLPMQQTRQVFEYTLADDPHAKLIILGSIGETLAEARALLFDRFRERLLSVEPYQWPPKPLCGRLQ